MSKLVIESEGRASFQCPGCGMVHAIRVSGEGAWQWNGSVDFPTLQPSVLFQSGHYAHNHTNTDRCWCTYNAEHPEMADQSFICVRCHSYVTDGKIQFLTDCTHGLVGQTVDLPEYER